MPVTVEWNDDSKSILLVIHHEYWTWEDTFQAYQDALLKVRSVSHPVHLIVDHSREVDPPTNFTEVLPRFAALPIPPHVGLIFLVGTKGATRIGSELFSLMYRKLQLVDLIEDAYAMIKIHDERRTKQEE